MNRLVLSLLLTVLLTHAAFASDAPALLDGNIVGNPGFEYDWMNNNAEAHILAFRGDWSFNSSDLKPDYWTLPAKGATWIGNEGHTGTHSLQLSAATITRDWPFAQTSAGGGGWAGPKVETMKLAHPERLARTLRAALWYKSADLAAGSALTLQIDAYGLSKKAVAEASAAQWTRLEVEWPREEIAKAYAAGKIKDLPATVGLTIAATGAAKVLIDDVSLAEDTSDDANLAVNGSFEQVDAKTGYPTGWSQPMKYRWRPPQYYRWTDWYHWYRAPRGPITTTDLTARTGRRSLLMQVYPGDEVLVEGAPVILNQAENGIIEIGAYVLLDRVKWVDLRAVDQDGNEVPCIHGYLGGQPPQDTAQNFPSNASSWTYVHKLFQGAGPLKSIRPRLCARGFNGNTLDDAGSRPQVCQTGLAWWDDVRVIDRTATAEELKARGVKVAPPVTEKPQSVMVASFDPGERLFGENIATLTLTNPTAKAIDTNVMLNASESDRDGIIFPARGGGRFTVQPGAAVAIPLIYQIQKLDGSWKQQGSLDLIVEAGGKSRRENLAYNTWPCLVRVDYATPAENPQTVSFNFGLAEPTVKSVKNLVIEVRRRGNDELIDTIDKGDLSAAIAETRANLDSFPKMEFDGPAPVFWADKKNLVALKMDFSKVPLHPADEPVRDAYLLVRGLDAAGKEVFRDKSQFFGRVAQIHEVLPKITETRVRPDGAILINGQPVFMMSCGGYPTNRYGNTMAMIKKYGFNAVRWVGIGGPAAAGKPAEGVPKIWADDNLYSLESMTGLGMTAANIQKWQAEGTLDGAVTLGSVYESGAALLDPAGLAQHKEFGRLAREVAHRVSNFGGGGAHSIYSVETIFDDYDSIGVELEPFGPPRGGYEFAPRLRKGGMAWFNLPQAYDTEPFEQLRLDQYAAILQGARGYSIIQGLGDPSLYRGLNGEMRYLSPAIFSQDKGDPATAVTPDLKWMQRRVANKTTLIVASIPPVEIGDWTWRQSNVFSGKRAHTGISAFAPNRTPDGLRLHGYRQDKPVMMQAGDVLVQYVWLDPKATPSTIAWGPRGDAKWDFNARYGRNFDFAKWKAEHVNHWAAGELLPGTWQITNDVNTSWYVDHILTPKSFPVQGALPTPGKWTRLEIKADEAGLVGKDVDGFLFLAKDGDAWWDHTALVRGGKETVLCEDTVGIPRDEVKAVHVKVPWAADGTKVKVLFEDRDLIVKHGEIVDDFTGEDVFGAIRDAAVGDAEGWFADGAKIYAQTLGYTTPNASPAVHVYEIVAAPK